MGLPVEWWIALAVYGVACAFAGQAVATGKGRAAAGFWLGLLLGVLGVAIALVLPPSEEHRTAEAIRINEAVQAASMSVDGRSRRPRPQRRLVRTPDAVHDLSTDADEDIPSASPRASEPVRVQSSSGDSGLRVAFVLGLVVLLVIFALLADKH